MKLKDFLIILLVICIFVSVFFGSISNFLGFNGDLFSEKSDSGDYVYKGENITSSKDNNVSNQSDIVYDDYNHEYDTGKYDSAGNKIKLSIISTSGGQRQPGVYEIYWSNSGVINETKIL